MDFFNLLNPAISSATLTPLQELKINLYGYGRTKNFTNVQVGLMKHAIRYAGGDADEYDCTNRTKLYYLFRKANKMWCCMMNEEEFMEWLPKQLARNKELAAMKVKKAEEESAQTTSKSKRIRTTTSSSSNIASRTRSHTKKNEKNDDDNGDKEEEDDDDDDKHEDAWVDDKAIEQCRELYEENRDMNMMTSLQWKLMWDKTVKSISITCPEDAVPIPDEERFKYHKVSG
jgi:hypothetical protein